MNLLLNSLIVRTIRCQRTRLGQKVLCLSILILVAVPFQLSGPLLQESAAAERLSIVVLDDMKGQPVFLSLMSSIQAAGFAPRTIREEDFAFNVSPKTAPAVVVPVGSHVSPDALNMLRRYITAGGRVILIPSGEAPDASVARLFALAGLPVSGLAHVQPSLSFNWKGRILPSGERLSKSNALLVIQPSEQMDVLATWGSDLPAIATTSKGAVLNWQWGRELSDTSNMVALSKVVYPGKADPLIMLQQDETLAQRTQQKLLASVPAQGVDPLGPDVEPNPSAAAPKSEAAPVAPIISPSPAASAPASVSTKPSPAVQLIPQASPATVKPSITAPSVVKGLPTGKGSAAAARATEKPAVESTDTEVLNNILGIHASESVKAGTAPPPADGKTGEQQQQHFSFLDPGAAAVLAPAFDYGVYSMNLRKLDDYKRRTRDALEAGRQLSLDLPEDKVNALLKEADLHKRKFESLYLAGQTQAGLDENILARHSALQALALTTTSPQVEGRAIWMDRGSIIACGNETALRAKIQKLHQAGINIIYFETVNAGFPIYPSKLVKHNPMVNGWDPLKIAVEEGHKQGMEVHAWVWCFAVGNRRHNALINQPDDYAGPILTEAGMLSEALRNHEGGLSVDSHQNEFWLSPASPKARDFLVNLYKEIVTNYDVDGLQLDYIRYPFQTQGNRMGFEAAGREHFMQSTGKSLDSMDDYTARVWTAWKTYQVSSFVQQVSTSLKKIKPELKLSAAVFPMHREARIAVIQQDWETWIDNGWIDTLSPMSYTTDPERLQDLFEYVQNSPHKHPLVYSGIALPRLDGGQLVEHLEALRQKGCLGSTLFAGSHLDDDKATTLAAGPYKQTNSLPPHQDVVKSLQAILLDYQQKLAILRKKGVLKDAPTEQVDKLDASLQRLGDSLNALGSGRPMSGISLPKLQLAQQRLTEAQVVSLAWSSADKEAHPYRAAYFERDMLLLSEIMGYTMDKLGAKPIGSPGLPPVEKKIDGPEPTASKAVAPTAAVMIVPTGAAPTAEPTANVKAGTEALP